MSNKEVRELVKHAEENGFTCIGIGGSGHWKLRHTSGRMLVVPATPHGGRRWRQNAEAMIKRINKEHHG